MSIKQKIFFGFIFVFTFAYILSAWAYYVHFESVIINNQKKQAKVINKNLKDALDLTIKNNIALLKTLKKDGDISLAYDNTEWLSIVGVAKTKKKFKQIFENHPFLKSMVFYKDNKILIDVVNKNDKIDDLLIRKEFDFSITNSKVIMNTNPILFLQKKLIEDELFNITHLYIHDEGKNWIITKDDYAPYYKKPINLQDVITLDNKKFITSNCERLANSSFCQVTLLPYSYYYNALKDMIINIFLLYCILLFVTYFVAKYLSTVIVKPILALKEASKQYEQDEFNPIKTEGNDEISQAIVAFNVMGQRIYNFTNELQNEVNKRTKELTEANKKLEKLATTDSLTGLYNRVKTDEFLNYEIIRFRRYKSKFSIMILDLDDFKILNDTYGHQTGDKVLEIFSDILKNSVRKADMVGRWGGEEFLVIMPETNIEDAKKLGEKIAKNLREYNFSFIKRSITVSVGVGEFTKEDNVKEFFARVDDNLYEAKKKGKDLVIG